MGPGYRQLSGRLLKGLPIVLAVSLLTACATTEEVLDSWTGSHVDTLISQWGRPQDIYSLSDGRKVVEYVEARTFTTGGNTISTPQTTYHGGSIFGSGGSASYSGTSTTYVTRTTPTRIHNYYCKVRFTISRSGIIEDWSYEGNAC